MYDRNLFFKAYWQVSRNITAALDENDEVLARMAVVRRERILQTALQFGLFKVSKVFTDHDPPMKANIIVDPEDQQIYALVNGDHMLMPVTHYGAYYRIQYRDENGENHDSD